MKDSISVLLEKYQIRKTKAQKQAFADWLGGHLSERGYRSTEDKYSDSGKNLIVGNVESAEVIITAHYDTPPNFFIPVLMGFSSWFSLLISQLILAVPMILLFVPYIICEIFLDYTLVHSLIKLLSIFPAFLFTLQMLCGIANKHNANDNTSGAAVLISVLEDLPPEARSKVCAVFFDQEELGLVGSGRFSKKYKQAMKNKPLINFDCVSDGDNFIFVMKKKFAQSEYSAALTKAAEQSVAGTNKTAHPAPALTHLYMSDQLHFPHGVGVVAAKKAPVFGYYINRIHSALDTKFDNRNIELLSETMINFIRGL